MLHSRPFDGSLTGLLLGLALIVLCVIGAVVLVWTLAAPATRSGQRTHTQHLVPKPHAITVVLVPPVALGRTQHATLPRLDPVFRHIQQHGHLIGCGSVLRSARWSYPSVAQKLAKCRLSARFAVQPTKATPKPTTPVPAPVSTQIPVPAPTPYVPVATPIPTPVSCTGQDCAAALLGVINTHRSQYGSHPLVLDQGMSLGVSGCIGALGHSLHMSQTGVLAHDQFPQDLCGSYTTGGENIGYAGGGSVWSAIAQIDDAMMAEPGYTPGCQSSHKCNILYGGYTRIGIGLVVVNGTLWISEDFEG